MSYALAPCPPPTIHLNGTAWETLVDQRTAIAVAARQLRTLLAEATPHDRDYYPQGTVIGRQARDVWAQRIALVKELERLTLAEAEWILDTIGTAGGTP